MADEDKDRHAIFVREGDRFTVRAQDGLRGAVLARYEIARVPGGGIACRQIAAPCSMCKGQTVLERQVPGVVRYGQIEKPSTHVTCPRCSGTGLRPLALEAMS